MFVITFINSCIPDRNWLKLNLHRKCFLIFGVNAMINKRNTWSKMQAIIVIETRCPSTCISHVLQIFLLALTKNFIILRQ